MTEPTSLRVPLATGAQGLSALPVRFARSLIMGRLEEIAFGELTVVDPWGTRVFGSPGSGPSAKVRIADPSVWLAIAIGGSLGAGESYIDGLWSTDDLVATVRILLRASGRLSSVDGGGFG
ncbi:MAG: hypothetical protein JSU89_08270, partial [Myxococcales bacterium]